MYLYKEKIIGQLFNVSALLKLKLAAYKVLLLVGLSILSSFALITKAQAALQYQDIPSIKVTVLDFLENQLSNIEGETNVDVGAVDPNIRLSKCHDLKAFLPAGSRVWGKTSVGVRCQGAARWTIYVQANVSVHGDYVVSAAPLARGTVVTAADLTMMRGDLTKLPSGVLTNMEQAIGQLVRMPLAAGAVLKQNALKTAPVVQRGQTVVLTTSGKGFKVAAEGKALSDAAAGQVVQVKVMSGQVVAGIADAAGQVVVKF